MAGIEFQILAPTLQDIFERQFKPYLSNTCTGWTIATYTADHLELSGPVQFSNFPGRVEAALPLDICLLTEQELEATLYREPAFERLGITAIYDITVTGLVMNINYRDVNSLALNNLLPPAAIQALKVIIFNYMTPQNFALNLAQQIATIDHEKKLKISSAAIATDGWLLTLRFEVDGTEGGNPGAALQVQPLPMRLAGQPLALWSQGTALEHIAGPLVQESVNEALQGAQTSLRWLPIDKKPRVQIVIRKDLDFIPEPFSATAVVTADVTFSIAPYGAVGGGSVLQTAVNWDWDIEGDFVSEAVADVVKMLKIGLPGVKLPKGAVQTGDKSFVILKAIPAAMIGPAKLHFGRITVVGDGMSLAGRALIPPLPEQYPLDILRQDWFVGYIATCSGRANDPTDSSRNVKASTSFTIQNAGAVCDVFPVDIPAYIVSHYIDLQGAKNYPHTVTIQIPEAALARVLQEHPGDFRFKVVTSRGVRLISLSRPHVVFGNDGRVENIEEEFINDCHWELIDPWAILFHAFNPMWLIDPSPELWVQNRSSAPVLEAITIRSHSVSTPLAVTSERLGQTAVSAANATRFFTSFLMPVTAQELTARLTFADINAAGAPPADIEIENRLLQRVSALALDEPASGIAIGDFQGQIVLAVNHSETAMIYLLEDLTEIFPIAAIDFPSSKGVLVTVDFLLAWSEFGLAVFDGSGTVMWREEPVLGVQQLPGTYIRYAVLTENGIAICNDVGQEINFIEAPGARHMMVLDHFLLLALPDQLQTFDIDGQELFSIAAIDFGGISTLHGVPAEFGERVATVMLEDESARLVRIFNTGEIEILAELESAPWFVDVALSNELAVFADDSAPGLVIYQMPAR